MHPETKAAAQDSPIGWVCLLDPAAAIPETVSPAPATDEAPIVQLAETAYDFGTMNAETDEFVHKFSIKNVGASQLKIKKIIPG